MAEKPEDLGLPFAVVSRIINDAIPSNTNVSSEARRVIGKTASVFVLYVTATAAGLAIKHGRKTMNSNDVMAALEEMDFHQFLEPVQKSLEYFRETQKTKKSNSTKKTASEEVPPKKSPAKSTSPTATATTASKPKKSPSTPPKSSPPGKSTPSTSKKATPSTTTTPKSSNSKKSSTTPAPGPASKRSSSAKTPSASTSKKSSPVTAPEVIALSDSD